VCLSEPAALFHSPSIAFDRGPSTLPSPLPPRFATPPARLPRAPPSNPAPETRFKSHSVGTRLPSNGCIESAPFRPSRGPSLFHRRASDTALTFRDNDPPFRPRKAYSPIGRHVQKRSSTCRSNGEKATKTIGWSSGRYRGVGSRDKAELPMRWGASRGGPWPHSATDSLLAC
jgi:hypothetical protein